jgi:hypothetical protein
MCQRELRPLGAILMGLLLLSANEALAGPALGSLLLSEKPTSLIDGRLTARLPQGAERLPPPEGVAPELALDRYRTSFVVRGGGQRLAIVAEELFATAGGDLRATVKRNLPDARLGALPDVPLGGSGLRAYAAPAPRDAPQPDLHPLSALYVVQRDDTVQVVSFYVDSAALLDGDGARELARRIGQTLAPGPRKLPAGSLVMQFPEAAATVIASLPDGFVASLGAGPGYAEYDLRRLMPMGAPTGFVRVSLGHGQALYSATHRIRDYSTSSGRLLGVAATWRRWFSAEGGVWMKETLVWPFNYGNGRQGRCHVRIAGRPEEEKVLRGIADSLKLSPTP